jgi:hypothetical protein
MIDISLQHADLLMSPFREDTAEHFGYAQELDRLDLRLEAQALYAIRKWLIPKLGWTSTCTYQVKEACRYCLTKKMDFGNVWLPGIADVARVPSSGSSSALYDKESTQFHLLFWNELFPGDPFAPADLSQYRQRVDFNFANFPHMPEIWETPEYKDWS